MNPRPSTWMTTLTTINGILQAQSACQLDMFPPPVFATPLLRRSGLSRDACRCLPRALHSGSERFASVQGCLIIKAGSYRFMQGVHLPAQAGNLLLQPDRLGLGDTALFAVGLVQRSQVTRDAGVDFVNAGEKSHRRPE